MLFNASKILSILSIVPALWIVFTRYKLLIPKSIRLTGNYVILSGISEVAFYLSQRFIGFNTVLIAVHSTIEAAFVVLIYTATFKLHRWRTPYLIIMLLTGTYLVFQSLSDMTKYPAESKSIQLAFLIIISGARIFQWIKDKDNRLLYEIIISFAFIEYFTVSLITINFAEVLPRSWTPSLYLSYYLSNVGCNLFLWYALHYFLSSTYEYKRTH